jgi:hypothetical protein
MVRNPQREHSSTWPPRAAVRQAHYGIQHLRVLPVEAAKAAVQERRSGGADYVGHLQRGPIHGSMPACSGLARAHRVGWRFAAVPP